ncbi:AAA family ATPase [Clavibacter michiganensis]|uniref:ATP-dependent zinc metalloprotease FtsH n=1 Tax=Clavibacter michiganensis subsp. michiganensis TaxID=33013 RepID=A0A1Y3FLJ5_CLAMM|nr:AAA family ATPase [Clavibacter michiganensis]MDO4017233.1 AAA family ATPase [Clavibacter michiganensis]MDO4030932.1 AAA family ATPase [Clavibacter michiganensis]MDO4037489.1 AAA family ATPase [Clavibacter michiganensis]MDO4039921.1 AAA family ATPase [Clavibacter michiganensis]MDO4050018.1 AAA family ATPase [Clavibacter michiganensis]
MAPEAKDRLLRSVVLGLHLRGTVPFHVSALHGLALLVGPPGTGKSTLVRGLAGQVAGVVPGKRCRLIEINPHGLMSAEHGQSQQRVHRLFTELIPSLADDQAPTILMLDEVESIAVARSAASLSANPADVHRATDAILTALDDTATRWPHIFTVATSNFASALDEAFKSRADVTISMPLPDEMAITAILRATLIGFGAAYPSLSQLAEEPRIPEVALLLVGEDGRSIRKSVTDAMLLRLAVTLDPNQLTIDDLLEAVTLRRVTEMEPSDAKS